MVYLGNQTRPNPLVDVHAGDTALFGVLGDSPTGRKEPWPPGCGSKRTPPNNHQRVLVVQGVPATQHQVAGCAHLLEFTQRGRGNFYTNRLKSQEMTLH